MTDKCKGRKQSHVSTGTTQTLRIISLVPCQKVTLKITKTIGLILKCFRSTFAAREPNQRSE